MVNISGGYLQNNVNLRKIYENYSCSKRLRPIYQRLIRDIINKPGPVKVDRNSYE